MNLFRHKREEHDEVEYHVKVDEFSGGEYDLIFSNRNKARAYKKALKDSKAQLQAQIFRREYMDSYILTDDKEVF